MRCSSRYSNIYTSDSVANRTQREESRAVKKDCKYIRLLSVGLWRRTRMDSFLKPNISRRRPSDVLADTLSVQAARLIERQRKTSAEMCKTKTKKKKTVRFPLDVDLQQAVVSGEVAKLKHLIQMFGQKVLKVRDPSGKPLTVTAALHDNKEILSLLVSEGSDLSQTDSEGYTALHIAAQDDSIEMANIILHHMGDKNLTNMQTANGKRPIDLCNTVEMADLLMHADLEFFLNDLDTMWDQESKLTELQTESTGGAVPKASDSATSGRSTSDNSNVTLKEDYILKHIAGASQPEIDKFMKQFHMLHGQSLLHFAAEYNYSHLGFFILEEQLESINHTDEHGWTPLHTAVYHNSVDMALLLIEIGASVFAKTHDNFTPMHYAEDELIISILVSAREAEMESSVISESGETLSE